MFVCLSCLAVAHFDSEVLLMFYRYISVTGFMMNSSLYGDSAHIHRSAVGHGQSLNTT